MLSCLYGMDIRDAELASLERKRGGKAKKRKKKADDEVASSFREADAGAPGQLVPFSARYPTAGCLQPAALKSHSTVHRVERLLPVSPGRSVMRCADAKLHTTTPCQRLCRPLPGSVALVMSALGTAPGS